jgi:hypothetical protein
MLPGLDTAGVGSKESVRGPGVEPLVGFGATPRGFPILDTPKCVSVGGM